MNVIDVLTKYKVHFIPSGNDYLIKCLNPNHEDSNPSMRVDKVTGIFHCFACGHKGNLFTNYGIEQSKLDILRNKIKKKVEQVTMERVGLQMPEDAVYWDTRYRNIEAETYKRFKAFTYEDQFPNRLVFPLFDITGKITNFCSRSFDAFEKKQRYKFYPPGASTPLFPMTVKPVYSTIVIVEGIFDMLNMYDKGVKYCVTAFGTQTVDEEKLSLLRMMGVSEIHLMFDGDTPGQDAAQKLIPFMESKGFLVKNIDLRQYFGEGTDPGGLTSEQVNKLRMKEWPEYS